MQSIASLLLCALRSLLSPSSTALLVFVALGPLVINLNGSELDPILLQRCGSECTPVVWENLEPNRQWVCGATPEFDRRTQAHWVSLDPGQFVEFKLLPRSMVRVAGYDGCHLTENDINIFVSNGSFAYKESKLFSGDDGHSVVAIPNASGTMLARVMCPEERPQGIVVAVYASRHIPLDHVDGWKCKLDGNVDEVTLTYSQKTNRDRWA